MSVYEYCSLLSIFYYSLSMIIHKTILVLSHICLFYGYDAQGVDYAQSNNLLLHFAQ